MNSYHGAMLTFKDQPKSSVSYVWLLGRISGSSVDFVCELVDGEGSSSSFTASAMRAESFSRLLKYMASFERFAGGL